MKSLVLLSITLALAKSLPLETDQDTEVALNEDEKIETPVFDPEVSDTADKLEIAERDTADKIEIGERGYHHGISEGIYLIENVETKRLLFQDGPKIKGSRGAEKGWKAHTGFKAPAVVGADANYYNRAYWKIIPQGGGKYLIENVETKRYLFQDGPAIKGRRGAEAGWAAHTGFKAPAVVGADANYYNRAFWVITPLGSGRYFIENVHTKRYVFQTGQPIKGKRGAEGGWKNAYGLTSPAVVGADANYYNRAYWLLHKVH